MSRRFMPINLAKFGKLSKSLCCLPSFADQPYINNYRVYDTV